MLTTFENVKARLAAAGVTYSRLFVIDLQLKVYQIERDYCRVGYTGMMGDYGLKVLTAYSEQFIDVDNRRRWRAVIRFTLKPLEPTYKPIILHPSAIGGAPLLLSPERAAYDELRKEQMYRAVEKFSEITFTEPEAMYKFARCWEAMNAANESDDTPAALENAEINNDITPEAMVYVAQMLDFLEGLCK